MFMFPIERACLCLSMTPKHTDLNTGILRSLYCWSYRLIYSFNEQASTAVTHLTLCIFEVSTSSLGGPAILVNFSRGFP